MQIFPEIPSPHKGERVRMRGETLSIKPENLERI